MASTSAATPSIDQTQLPWRFRERAFRVYEPIIAQVISAYPSVITFNPQLQYRLSPVTFACRFRDALKSYAKHSWPSSLIDRKRFEEVCNKIATSEGESFGIIRIGDKTELKRPSLEILNAPARQVQLMDICAPVLSLRSDAELDLIVKLAALRLLVQEVKCTGFTEETKTKYEKLYDCSIEIDPATGIASVL
jgi:hypothetical protein